MNKQPYRTSVVKWAISINGKDFHKAAWSTVVYSLYDNKREAQDDIDSFKIDGVPMRVRITIQKASSYDQ